MRIFQSIMRNYLIQLFFTLFILFSVMSSIQADNTGQFKKPTELGPYQIGHTTMIVTDTTRNPNGSPGTLGRPLFMHIWYPSRVNSGTPVSYTVNNTIYNVPFPGFPPVVFSAQYPSVNGVLEGAPIASGQFPLLIYSHGSLSVAGNEQKELRERLASHGYIVVAPEHSGNSLSFIVAFVLRDVIHILPPSTPNPNMTFLPNQEIVVRRSQDVSFVINQMLNPVIDPQFQSHIDANKIGVLGYSLGGGTAMVEVAGLQSRGILPDTRIKAAAALDGTDFVNFTNSDYANIQVPVLLYQDSNGQNPSVFPKIVNSSSKYYADVSAALHVPGDFPSMCDTLHRNLVWLDANPSDIVTIIDTQGLIGFPVFSQCDASVFSGISDPTLVTVGANLTEIAAMKNFMPLRKEVSLEELERLANWYVISFFNFELKGDNRYQRFLEDSQNNKQLNPLIDFAKNCRQNPSNALDLQAGNKITFTPNGKRYQVSFSANGNALLDKGSNLNLGDEAQKSIALGFSFPMPNIGMINNIVVTSNGAITIGPLVSQQSFGFNGSPWFMKGELLLNGEPTIAPLMVNLNPAAGGGVYTKVETDRVIVTWDAVPVSGTTATNTMQVVINKNGVIDMIYGSLANTGPSSNPSFIGNVGIASGQAVARDIQRLNPIDFSSLINPVTLPPDGIFEQFYNGSTGSCE